MSTGVRMDVWRLPAELTEAKVGPVFTHDDVLDLHLLLQRDDWYEQLCELVDDGSTGTGRSGSGGGVVSP